MKNREAQGVFKESEILYRERRYDEALDALQRLDVKYPNTRNILYPIAKCLRRLGRFDEAATICDRLILEFNDERARHIRKQVERSIQRSNAQTIQVAADVQANIDDEIDAGFDALDLGDLPPLDEEAPTVHLPGGYSGARPVQQSEIPWMYIGIGAAVVIFLLIVVVAAMSGGGAETSASSDAAAAEPEEIDVTQFYINLFGFSIVATLICYWASLYLTLLISDKRPFNIFTDDALSVFGYALLGTVLTFVLPCIGLIINVVLLRKRYDLTFIDVLMLIGIYVGTSIPFSILSSVLFSGTMSEIAASMETTA